MANTLPGQAGFQPEAALTLVNDCGIVKGPPTQYTADDLAAAVAALLASLDCDGTTN